MKILVTGATGFVGKYVIQELLATSHQIVIAGRNVPVTTEWRNAGIAFKELDIDNINPSLNYFSYFEKPDILIHLAWQGLPNYTQLFHFEKNLPTHYYFIKNLVSNGLQHLTIAGTCFEYGMQQGELREDFASLPDNAYALAKYTLYSFLKELQKSQPSTLR